MGPFRCFGTSPRSTVRGSIYEAPGFQSKLEMRKTSWCSGMRTALSAGDTLSAIDWPRRCSCPTRCSVRSVPGVPNRRLLRCSVALLVCPIAMPRARCCRSCGWYSGLVPRFVASWAAPEAPQTSQPLMFALAGRRKQRTRLSLLMRYTKGTVLAAYPMTQLFVDAPQSCFSVMFVKRYEIHRSCFC